MCVCNRINIRPLTPHVMPCYTHKMAVVRGHRYCDVTSPCVWCGANSVLTQKLVVRCPTRRRRRRHLACASGHATSVGSGSRRTRRTRTIDARTPTSARSSAPSARSASRSDITSRSIHSSSTPARAANSAESAANDSKVRDEYIGLLLA